MLTEALIDSGANMSVFSADIADYLEVELEAGKKIYLQGIGGRILGYAHTIKIDIEKKEFKLKVVFSRELFTSFNILGRDNFFNFFRIIFDEENKMFALE
ncbi:hypothetical protein JXI42_10990 [bacterium]|nr:hypothetical protein [bacterium]